MPTESQYKGIQHVIQVDSNKESICPDCPSKPAFKGQIAERINHLVTEHGYKILYIGTETEHAPTIGPSHFTVAILGR